MKNQYLNLKSWSTLFAVCFAFVLLLGTNANAQTTFGPFTESPALAIPDNGYDGTLSSMAASPITVSGVTGTSVVDISVELAIDHTWVGDLIIKLQSPDGDILTLTSSPGGAEAADDGTSCAGDGDNLVSTSPITFSDAGVTDGETLGVAGGDICAVDGLCSYFPSPGATVESATSFADFFGTNMNGVWTLYLGDDCGGDAGTIQSWSITIVTASPSIEVYKTVALEDGNGDCSDDVEPPLYQSSLEVNSGDNVCYFYTAFNTGDVAFSLHDVTDDILGPLATELAFNLDTAAGVYLAIGPVNITSNVVNTVTWDAYNAGPVDVASGTASAVVTIAGATPVNDNVCDALPLSAGLVLNPGGNSANATVESGEPVPPAGTSCESQDGWCSFELTLSNTVWFTFVAPASGSVTINTDGSYDTQLAVYEAASCSAILSGGATLLAANDDNPDYLYTQFSSLVDVACLTPGQTYYVQVDGYQGASGDLYVELIENPGEAVSATVSGGGVACDGGTADVQVDLTGVGPWDVVVLVDGANPSTQTAVATSPLVLAVSNAGTVTIESVTDANGCSAIGQGSAVVTVGTSPTAAFTSFQDPAGLDVDFSDASSESPTSWAWDFGDGGTSTAQNPTHTYSSSGTYTVCLIATNDCGSSTQVCEQVVVTQPVVPNDDACDALPIGCGDALDGSTNFADYDASVTTAGRGVWYVFEGNGQDVTLSTCNAATFDTEITIQTGADCNSLTTLTSNDDATGCSGFTSEVAFYAEYGTSYYVHVAHYSTTAGTTGDFTLSATCACPTPLDAGTLNSDLTPVCLDSNGEANLTATEGTAPQVPAGYTVTYVLTSGGANYIIEAVNSMPDFTVTAGGAYTIHTLVSTGTLDLSGVVFGQTAAADVLAIVAGDDNICAALDVTGAPFTVNAPDAGTITAVESSACLDQGSATISAIPDGNQEVPTGYVTIYALTDADNNLEILQTSTTPSFTVTSAGNYVIHTFVYDPNELDPSLLPPGTTGGDVAVLLVENGGTVCASLDVAGAPISVDPSCGPENDLCGDAIAIACGGTATGSTEFATSDASAVDCNSGRIGVWYVFTGTGDNLAVSTSNAGTDYDTYLGISESCGGPCVASNDDDPNGGLTSLIEDFPTVLGQDYYIFVSGFSTEVGNYELTVTCTTPPPPPANDNVCDAIGLSMGANGPYDVSNATAESGEPVPPAGTGSSTCESQDGWCSFELAVQNSVWFTFVAPASGTITVNTDDSYDTQVAIYEATSCQDVTTGGATLLGANDDNPDAIITSFSSELTVCGLTPGSMYYLQVDGYNGDEGPLNIDLSEPLVADWSSSATNLDVDFTDASSAAGSIVSWDWDFGDGNVSTDQNPSHSYAAANTYTVCLTVTDDAGCSTTYCEDVTVTDIPTSIAEAVENGMEVFPNPSNGEFVVAIRGVEADVQIIVMDVTGRQVYNEGVALSGNFRKDVNLGSVAKGSYILQIATTEGVVNRKIQVH